MKLTKIFGLGAAALLLAGPLSAALVINEVDCDTPGTDTAEFVEISGIANESMNGHFIALVNGSGGAVYNTAELTGNLPSDGFYVVTGATATVPNADFGGFQLNQSGYIQNGEDCVLLVQGDINSFPATVTTSADFAGFTIVDKVVYETGGDTDQTVLWDALFGSGNYTVIDEDANSAKDGQSISRNPDVSGSFEVLLTTPGATNVPSTTPVIQVDGLDGFDFGSYNAATAAPVTATVTITNIGGGTLNVSTLELDAGSSAAFSAVASAGIPAALTTGQSVDLDISFETAATTTQSFSGTVNFATDAAVDGSGSIPLTADYVNVVQTASAGNVVINEFAADPNPGSPNPIQDFNNDGNADASQDEFIELYNRTGAAIDISGWVVTSSGGATFMMPAGTSIAASGHVVVFGGGTPNLALSTVSFAGSTSRGEGRAMVLGNGGAILSLSDGTTVIDSVAYGSSADGMSGAVTETGNAADGGSNGRYLDGATDDAPARQTDPFIEFAWDDANADLRPSPGVVNGSATTDVEDWLLY